MRRATTSEKYTVENPACIPVLLLQNNNFCNSIKKNSNNKQSPNYMVVYNRRKNFCSMCSYNKLSCA